MKSTIKQFLKRLFPPTIYIFNREINILRTEHESEQRELLTTFKQESEQLRQELREQLRIQNEQLRQDQELRFTSFLQESGQLQQELREQLRIQNEQLRQDQELRFTSFINEWEKECKAQIDAMQLLMDKFKSQISEQMGRQEQDKEQIISAVWDSRNGALWEAKEEMRIYNRQWQQIFWYWLAVRDDMSIQRTKETFFQALPKAEGNVRQLQKMELYLLRQLVKLCVRYGLKYWMTDGSLLGTVRHKGFVPWDDDMDVGMPRADFERLRELLKDNPHFQVVDYYCLSEPRWFSKISKFVDRDSGSSVFIDIFPYDCYDVETQQEAREQYHIRREKLVNALEKLIPTLKCRYQDVQVEDPGDKAALDAVFAECVTDISQSGKWLGWSVEIWESEVRTGFPERVIFPCSQETFEGIPVCIPADAGAWLKQVYGEYMEFPRDVGIQNHMTMFGIDQQAELIEAFLEKKVTAEGQPKQESETEASDGSGQTQGTAF